MKKILTLALAALLALSVLSVTAFAAEEPTVTNDTKAYVSYNFGNNEYSGATFEEPKKQLLTFEDNGVVSLLKDGGTMVVCGKLYIGGNYTLPEMSSTLLITSNDGTTDYKNMIPFDNPSCAMKMAKGATFTITSDVIFDDIILFQEYENITTIKASNNSTVVFGENIVSVGCPASANPAYMAIEAEAGSTVIVKSGTYQRITGEGEIIVSDGVTVIENGEAAETTAAPAEVTDVPAVATTEAVDTTDVAETTDAVETTDVAETTDVVETTVAPTETEEPAAETTEEKVGETAPATTEAPADEADGGAPVGIIVAAIAAVVVVVAIIAVVAKKKK